MSYLYLTADQIGTPTGGGSVTFNESEALKTLGDCQVISRKELEEYKSKQTETLPSDPWIWDYLMQKMVADKKFQLAHFYSGTSTETVKTLKQNNCKVVYTIAAHSVEASQKAHEDLGIPYAKLFPHLCEEELWKQYSGGYWESDVIVCPSQHSANVVNKQHQKLFGVPCKRVEIIPHGCHIPNEIKPLPKQFVLGYMGSCGGPDKGIIYLLQAWKRLNYNNSLLILAGRDSVSDYVKQLVSIYGGGNIYLAGWQRDVGDFYNQISVLIQPSVSEGFGMEVLESMSYGRLSLCSTGAGAVDLALDSFPSCSVESIISIIEKYKTNTDIVEEIGVRSKEVSKNYTWNKIKQMYIQLWKKILE